MSKQTYDVLTHVNYVTDKALRVNLGTSVEWLPKSQLDSPDMEIEEIEVGDKVTLTLPEWLAKEKGIL